VADKDDALTQVACCDAHRISDVMPLRFCGIGDAEQRRDDDAAPALFELASNRQPARGSHERAVNENER
jgi:hypothetical protein